MKWRFSADHGHKHETGGWIHSELDDPAPITEAEEPKVHLRPALLQMGLHLAKGDVRKPEPSLKKQTKRPVPVCRSGRALRFRSRRLYAVIPPLALDALPARPKRLRDANAEFTALDQRSLSAPRPDPVSRADRPRVSRRSGRRRTRYYLKIHSGLPSRQGSGRTRRRVRLWGGRTILYQTLRLACGLGCSSVRASRAVCCAFINPVCLMVGIPGVPLVTASKRHNARVTGTGERAIVFAHGFGCDQNMWRLVAPTFEEDFRVVLFDHVGAGGSDLSAYEPTKYGSIDGYASDVVELCRELDIRGGVYVGHSVSAMIGVLAAKQAPELFDDLVLIGPSPRYIDSADYAGGFTEAQIHELLEFLDNNHMGWSQTMAPVIMGNADRPELAEELTNSFCRTDPEIAKQFARTTFLSDNRADLDDVVQRSLILQCSDDLIAPRVVGEYVHFKLPNSTFVQLAASGHCPNLSAPEETIAAIRAFL